MSYRNDRDALRTEVENLQQELGAARADQQRLQHLEQRLAAAKREMDAVETELERARRQTKPASAIAILFGVLFIVAFGAGLAMFLVVRRQAPVAVVVPQPRSDPAPTGVAPEPVTPPIALPPPIVESATPPRRVHVTWSATVTRSTEASIHPGSACKINANAIPDSSGMHVVDVEVACGEHTIYDENGDLNGMSMLDSDAKQRPGAKAGTWVYDLVFSDAGTRSTTRNQASLDSTLKIGKVWSDNMPDFRVDLAIKPGSAPVAVAVLDP